MATDSDSAKSDEETVIDPNIEQLMDACKIGNIGMINKLLHDHPEIDVRECRDHAHKGTALHMAASNKQHDIVSFLIEEKACDPMKVNQRGHNVLHRAVRGGDLKSVKYLVERGCDPMTKCYWERNALHHACIKNQLEILKYLTKEERDTTCRDNKYFLTPLDLACEYGSLEMVKYLLEDLKCDMINVKGHNTPLHQAAYGGKNDIVKYLIHEKGISPICKGSTPLHSACKAGQVSTVKLLLEHKKALCTHKDATAGATPLHKAAQHGKLEVVKVLVEKFGCDIHATNWNGETPAITAEKKGHHQIVQYLREPSGEYNHKAL